MKADQGSLDVQKFFDALRCSYFDAPHRRPASSRRPLTQQPGRPRPRAPLLFRRSSQQSCSSALLRLCPVCSTHPLAALSLRLSFPHFSPSSASFLSSAFFVNPPFPPVARPSCLPTSATSTSSLFFVSSAARSLQARSIRQDNLVRWIYSWRVTTGSLFFMIGLHSHGPVVSVSRR